MLSSIPHHAFRCERIVSGFTSIVYRWTLQVNAGNPVPLRNLKIKFLFSAAYYPQTNGQSERTNQSVEIALRFGLTSLKNKASWPLVLPQLSLTFCNSANFSSTGKTPSQILYGFRVGVC